MTLTAKAQFCDLLPFSFHPFFGKRFFNINFFQLYFSCHFSAFHWFLGNSLIIWLNLWWIISLITHMGFFPGNIKWSELIYPPLYLSHHPLIYLFEFLCDEIISWYKNKFLSLYWCCLEVIQHNSWRFWITPTKMVLIRGLGMQEKFG